jgi:hypothetical protein
MVQGLEEPAAGISKKTRHDLIREVPVIKKLIQAAALLAVCGGAAHASTYDFSYTFTSGDTVTGSFDGTANGNLVTNITDITAVYDGQAFVGTLSIGAFNSTAPIGVPWNFSQNAAVVSTNASLNNFIIADSTDPGANGVTNYFYYVNGATPDQFGSHEAAAGDTNLLTNNAAYDNDQFNGVGQWTLTPAPVPLPAALPLLMSGLGLFGIARRRKAA